MIFNYTFFDVDWTSNVSIYLLLSSNFFDKIVHLYFNIRMFNECFSLKLEEEYISVIDNN